MARGFSKPGPPPKSCHTCRRRRKKCDLSKPSCKRCLKGGYECLGYGDTDSRVKIHQEASSASAQIASQARPIPALDRDQVDVARSNALAPDSIPKDWQDPTKTDASHDSRPSILRAALEYRLGGPISSTNDENVTTYFSDDFDFFWSQSRSQSAVYLRSSTHQSPGSGQFHGTSSNVKREMDDLTRAANTLSESIPRSVDTTQIMREDHLRRVMNYYDFQRSSSWFMNPPPAARRPLMVQMKRSKGMSWAIYLEARLFQALDQNPRTSGTVQGYIGWIDKLEERFTTDSDSHAPLRDVAERLMVQLELAFLKFTVVDGAMGYDLLRRALPRFLQVVAADPNLYTELPDGNSVVSFLRTLCAPRSEIPRFVLYDTIAAFILGIPPLVEYGYDGECDSRSDGHGWIHGIPVAFTKAISQINSWRASLRTPPSKWKDLERLVLAWQPSSDALTKDSATDTVIAARVAVQEGWKHVVLIYLYMGICGVSSHDSRVQAAVHRIFQLGETVTDLPIGVHMFSHCVVAGLAARREKHRALVHRMLLSFRDTRVILFRGSQFSQVLCHLWHGVGAGGSPVIWDDYVRSRCATIPI